MKLQNITALIILFTVLFFGKTEATAQEVGELTRDLLSPRLVAVKFHADWCTECKKMANITTDLQNRFDGKPILFLTFDRTNTSSRHSAELLASALGLEEIYKKYQGTGFIVLIEWKSKKVLKMLTPENSMDDIVQTITNAITY